MLPVELYPRGPYAQNPLELTFKIKVPSAGSTVTIEKVHLRGYELLMLCKFGNRSSLCAIGEASAKVTVHLPEGLDGSKLKVNTFFVGKTWNWTDGQKITYLTDEQQYIQIVAGLL